MKAAGIEATDDYIHINFLPSALLKRHTIVLQNWVYMKGKEDLRFVSVHQ
jgi:hypothetical protein